MWRSLVEAKKIVALLLELRMQHVATCGHVQPIQMNPNESRRGSSFTRNLVLPSPRESLLLTLRSIGSIQKHPKLHKRLFASAATSPKVTLRCPSCGHIAEGDR